MESKGAEVVKFDIAIKEDIKNALSGADIAWVVTNFLDPVSNIYFIETIPKHLRSDVFKNLCKFRQLLKKILVKKKDKVKWLPMSRKKQDLTG